MDRKIDFSAALADVGRYSSQIRKLFEKLKLKQQLFETRQAGVDYFSFGLHESDMASLLRNAVLKENYSLQPAKERTIVKKNKQRKIYLFQPTDKLVISVVIKLLAELAEQKLADNVYAYRPGRTIIQPVASLAKQIADHLLNHAGVYVFKTDIADYTDCIRLDEGSVLWQQVRNLFDEYCTSGPSAYQWQLIKSCFRPEFVNTEKLLQTNIQGVPTGSVSSTLAYNLYACDIDQAMNNIPGLFYVRYSDDIILAHPDHAVMQEAIAILHATIYKLGLRVKHQKEERLYVNAAAKGSPQASEWLACNKFTYLGHDIYGNGTFLISTSRQLKFLRAIRARIAQTAKILANKPSSIKGAAICEVVNSALQDEQLAEFEAQYLLQGTNHAMLRHLDYLIALHIAEDLTQVKGPRAFRHIPYKRLREEWQLKSLVQLANN
jgi:hypothetical protein